ncbi:hypothetical protein Tcan_00692, partial [Toxocara canis]
MHLGRVTRREMHTSRNRSQRIVSYTVLHFTFRVKLKIFLQFCRISIVIARSDHGNSGSVCIFSKVSGSIQMLPYKSAREAVQFFPKQLGRSPFHLCTVNAFPLQQVSLRKK